MARKVIIEVEVPEGASLDEILRGVKYRVVEDRVEKRRRALRRFAGILGEASSNELDRIAQEAWEA